MAKTLIEIDDGLLERARAVLGPNTSKKDAVNTALSKLVRWHDQRETIDWIIATDPVADLRVPEVRARQRGDESYLVDNSVQQRLPRSVTAQAAVGAILDENRELCCCALTLDESCFSVLTITGHAEASRRLSTPFLFLPASPHTDRIVIDIRSALSGQGRVLSMSPSPLPPSPLCLSFGAIILHYDNDFDHISDNYPDFRAQ